MRSAQNLATRARVITRCLSLALLLLLATSAAKSPGTPESKPVFQLDGTNPTFAVPQRAPGNALPGDARRHRQSRYPGDASPFIQVRGRAASGPGRKRSLSAARPTLRRHGGGPNTSQIISERADAYAFLIQTLGMNAK
jgi:hypothetical protein